MGEFFDVNEPGGRTPYNAEEFESNEFKFRYALDEKECVGCESIQIIQIVWAPKGKLGLKGKHLVSHNNTRFGTFVDGGINSPHFKDAGEETFPGKPYYNSADEVTAATEDYNKCTVEFYDFPNAAMNHQEIYFETAIICVNYQNTGKDKVIKVTKWGFTHQGRRFLSSPGSGGRADRREVYDDVSQEFRDTLKHDYPNYTLLP